METVDATQTAEGALARVRAIDAAGYQLFVEFRSGKIASLEAPNNPFAFEVGDLLLVDPDNSTAAPAPDRLWPDTPDVGVVRTRDEENTIVAVDGRLVLVPTNDTGYEVGNTVEVQDGEIVGVLTREPVSLFRDDDDVSIDHLKVNPSELTEDFEDYGGMESVVERARELIELPPAKKELLKETGARPVKGVLMTGPPGTGKTMLARIIAKESGAALYVVNGPQIFSKWQGDSEAVLRRVFDDAAKQERSIIFFDEIDSVAGRREESYEGSRRVVAQLLGLMDGFKRNDNVIVVAATNRVDDIDKALRRPGRFDWEIKFHDPTDEDRAKILLAASRHLNVADHPPLEELARLTAGWTSAQLAAIWNEAALLAMGDSRGGLKTEDCWGGYERVRDGRARQLEPPPRQRTEDEA
jgi:transitional endoplasmic reticulum ATPase